MQTALAVAGPVALLALASGIAARNIRVTVAALAGLVALAVLAIPVGLAEPQANMPGLVAIEVAAVVTLATLSVWWSTRRYPLYAAVATFILGTAAALLLISAAV